MGKQTSGVEITYPKRTRKAREAFTCFILYYKRHQDVDCIRQGVLALLMYGVIYVHSLT